MKIEIEFEYGPLSAKIDSDEDEPYEKVLNELSSFIESEGEIFADVDLSDSYRDREKSSDANQANGGSGTGDSNWGSLISDTGLSAEELQYIFQVDRDSNPQILVGEHITGSKNQQMEEGALLLLAVWEEYYGKEEATVTEITTCLENSGLPSDKFSNVYQRQSFNAHFVRNETDREDGGVTSVMKLTPPGRSKAYDLISELSQEIN